MPVAVAPDDPLASDSPDPSVVAGYVDCLKEALKFLLERERLPPQHPVVAGLALHLARPSAHNFLRKAPTLQAPTSASHRRNEHDSASERELHKVKRTVTVGKQRASHRRRPLQHNAVFATSSNRPGESSSHRDINGELRHNLQNIVDNLESAISDTQDEEESEDYFSDEDSVEVDEISSNENDETYPHYDVDENDLDAEIDTILGDSVLRRELVRLVYQGCDLIATAPLQPPSPALDASPASPQMGATAEPDRPVPQPI